MPYKSVEPGSAGRLWWSNRTDTIGDVDGDRGGNVPGVHEHGRRTEGRMGSARQRMHRLQDNEGALTFG